MMNKKEIFKKVGVIITELNEQYEYLSQSSDNLNELELELFAANANFLSDHIAILLKLNESAKKVISTEAETTKNYEEVRSGVSAEAENHSQHPEQPVETIIPDWKFELKKDEEEVFQLKENFSEKLSEQPLSEEENRRMDEETQLKTETEKEFESQIIRHQDNVQVSEEPVIKEVVIAERTVALLIEQAVPDNPSPTVNDLLSKQSLQSTVASQISQRQIKDLKSMISLNDKLLFVRDLFNGYSLAYSEAIELLNRFDRIESAENFLKQNYAQKNNWNDKQPAADKFYEVLRDRFK